MRRGSLWAFDRQLRRPRACPSRMRNLGLAAQAMRGIMRNIASKPICAKAT